MLIIILAAATILNFILWRLYRRDLASELEATKLSLEIVAKVARNLHSYCKELETENRSLICYEDELHARCERYRQAMLTEALN